MGKQANNSRCQELCDELLKVIRERDKREEMLTYDIYGIPVKNAEYEKYRQVCDGELRILYEMEKKHD